MSNVQAFRDSLLDTAGFTDTGLDLSEESLAPAALLGDFSRSINVEAFDDRSIELGSGADVTNFPSDKSYAFNRATYTGQPIKEATLSVEYYHDEQSVAQSVGGGDKFSASITYSAFSLGGSFESSSLKQNAKQRISGHLLLKFQPTYNPIPLADTKLNDEAQALFDGSGLRAFYERYGTHYVSSVKPAATYVALFSFYFSSNEERDQTEQSTGLSLGIMSVFSLGFSNTLKTEITKTGRQISFQYREFSSTGAGMQPLPLPTEVTDPTKDSYSLISPTAIITRYNTYLAALKQTSATASINEVSLSPFASLLEPATAVNIPVDAVTYSTYRLRDLNAIVHDYNLMQAKPEVWPSIPTTQAVFNINTLSDDLRKKILDVLAAPTNSSVQDLGTTLDAATKAAGSFFSSDLWPALVKVKVPSTPPPPSPVADPTLTLQLCIDKRLGQPSLTISGIPGSDSRFSPIYLNSDLVRVDTSSAGTIEYVIWQYGPLTIKTVTGSTPPAARSIVLTSQDGAGRSRQLLLYSSLDPKTLQVPLNKWVETY